MIDSFEDGDLSFEVLEQLGGHLVALNDLDGDGFPSRLRTRRRIRSRVSNNMISRGKRRDVKTWKQGGGLEETRVATSSTRACLLLSPSLPFSLP